MSFQSLWDIVEKISHNTKRREEKEENKKEKTFKKSKLENKRSTLDFFKNNEMRNNDVKKIWFYRVSRSHMHWCLFFFSSCQRRFFFLSVSLCWVSLINNIFFVVFFLLTLLFCIVSSSDFDLRFRFSKFEFFVVRFFFVKAEIEIRVAKTLKFNDCNEILNTKSILTVTRIKRLTWTLKMFFFEHSSWYTSKKLMIETTTNKNHETHNTHNETRYTWWEEV